MRPLAGLLLAGLGFAGIAAAQSVPFPTYTVGENQNGSQGPNYPSTLPHPWVASSGQILTPAGIPVYLGITTRAKAIALNPNTSTHTAAVLQMGGPQAVSIFDTQTGAVLQTYTPAGGTDPDGSNLGITYTPDGKYLLFSQDGNSYYFTFQQGAFVAIANVDPTTGLLSDYAQVPVLMDVDSTGKLTTVNCFNNSPGGTNGSFDIPCGFSVSQFSDGVLTAYPMGIAVSSDGKTAYVVLDNNNTLAKLDLTTTPPTQVAEIRVGNVPHSVVISPDGKTAYVSNEAGRIANANDFQEYSNGTNVVAAYPTGSTSTGTVSVVNLATFTVTGTIETGLHPTGMAFWGKNLLVTNTYSDSVSVIDTTCNQVVNTINLGLPVAVPGEWESAYGAGPNSIAVDAKGGIAYVALYNANAIAVVDLSNKVWNPVLGMIPVGYAPSSVVLDAADKSLLVANDKGIGSTGFGVAPPPTDTAENSYAKYYGVSSFNTHQDLGTAGIIPLPDCSETLAKMTKQVFQNNHWDLLENIWSAGGGSKWAKPVAIPAKIGDPSLIKHVFVIIRENRTYDQMLGDVAAGNGDPTLAVFGDSSTYAEYPVVTPNAHALVERFPLLDNFYDPSRQSADGHNWIVQAMAPYSDDIQSPDWLRDYPSNGGDAIAYQQKGHLWDQAAKYGVSFKNYGEYIEYNTFTVPGCTPNNMTLDNDYSGTVPPIALPFIVSNSCEPSWAQFYNDTLEYESGNEAQLQYFNSIGSVSPLPNLIKHTVPNYPQFDLGIPDQYRVDVWKQDFAKDLAEGKVPQLEFLWIMSDHTTGPPNATAEQADNDLAVGRVIDIISHSPVWSTSAIFIEEDDAQNGVDHVDGHRSPGYVISPFVLQKVNKDGTGAGVIEESTFYTQVNMTRTIEQILGLAPMNQNDLVASPMRTLFVDNPPQDNFLPWKHVPNGVPLCYGVKGYVPPSNIPPSFNTCNSTTATTLQDNPKVEALRAGWLKMKETVFAAKYHTPDSLDPDTVSHYDWYDATGYKVPFPGEKTVRPASDFSKQAPAKTEDDDD
ncbi:MAG TPA: alkaline phosphatase family protein [Candidatus Sulfotelmatobacter sp.]|nr:alkaline phosphatase family protein [Candidatus Sulfotelmatobacter sp.]